MDESQNLRGQVVRGSAWMIAMRWTVRFIGLLSTLILARILTPEDFGLVAMAMLVVGFLELFTEAGMPLALIRHPNPTKEHFDTVWTLRLLTSLLVVVALLMIAPVASVYFREPRAEILIQIMSLKAVLGGLENVGIVWFRRNMDFASEYRFFVYKKLVPFVVTLGLAFWLQNYWALIIGIIVGQGSATVISFLMHPHRPRWCLSRFRELWSFSFWVLISYIGGYLQSRVDQVIVGGVVPAQQFGHYSLASEISQTPTAELIEPIGRVLYPAYSKLYLEPERHRDAYLSALSITMMIAAPGASGLAVVAHDLIPVVLGEQWVAASPLVVWLALGAGILGICHSVNHSINAAGFAFRNAIQTWTRFIVLAVSLSVASRFTDVEGLAMTSMGVALFLMPTYFFQLKRVLPLRWRDFALVIWRPVCASAIMTGGLLLFGHVLGDLSPAVRLLVQVLSGMLAFGGSLFCMWHLSGRPKGGEALVFEFALSRFGGNKVPPAAGHE